MTETLSILWSCFDSADPVFSALEVASWPAEDRRWLLAQGLLKETTSASRIACPSCATGHVEDVLEILDAVPRRFFIPCPESLKVEIDPEDLRQWTIDLDTVTTLVAVALGLSGQPKAIEPGRMWRLGTTTWQQTSREVLLARGFNAEDAATVASHVGQAGRPIILFAGREPPPTIWPGRPPACVELSRVLSHNATGLQFDGMVLHDVVQQADQLHAQLELMPLDQKGKKRLLRRQVQAAVAAHQEDEVLLAAYRECNSYRAAAAALSERLKTKVTKDKVKRAVDRAGGPVAVINGVSSNSVVRAVASHRRDKGGRF